MAHSLLQVRALNLFCILVGPTLLRKLPLSLCNKVLIWCLIPCTKPLSTW